MAKVFTSLYPFSASMSGIKKTGGGFQESLLKILSMMTNLDSIFKSRDITLLTKIRLVKAMVFPVVMYGCESWTVKKDEHQRIDAFELWCWRRLYAPMKVKVKVKFAQSCSTLCDLMDCIVHGILQPRILK